MGATAGINPAARFPLVSLPEGEGGACGFSKLDFQERNLPRNQGIWG